MSTAYTIFRVDRPPAGDAQVRIFDVLWREEEAVEMVERLNTLAADGQGGYAWSPVWVARRGAETPVSLTPDDRELLELARSHGALDTERSLAAFFSFIFNGAGARAACKELDSLGWLDADADEEATGDECWHVRAEGRRIMLNPESILRLRSEMEDLAERHGGKFDGWDVSGSRGLRRARPGELPM